MSERCGRRDMARRDRGTDSSIKKRDIVVPRIRKDTGFVGTRVDTCVHTHIQMPITFHPLPGQHPPIFPYIQI